MKGFHFLIKLNIYPYHVLVSIGETDDALRNSLEDKKKKIVKRLSMKDAYGWAHNFKDGTSLIRVIAYEDTPKWKDILAHEILHTIFDITKYVGIKYSPGSEEAFTYLMSYLTREIYTAIDNKLKK